MAEAEYAVKELGARCADFYQPVWQSHRQPEFFQLYKELDQLGTALWIHPQPDREGALL